MNRWLFVFLLALMPIAFSSGDAWGQGTASLQVSFRNEVAPILAKRCLRCHGPEEAEADFRVDERSSLEAYIEPGSHEDSDLYLMVTSTEEGYRMPPDLGDRLTADELMVLEQWIIMGPRFEKVEDWEEIKFLGTDLSETDTVSGALWALLGRFHPAMIHFPIALLTVAAFLAVFGFGNVHTDKAAVYCLVLGTLGSFLAAASGWGFAEYRKWPDPSLGWNRGNQAVAEASADTEEEEESSDEPQPRAEAADATGLGGPILSDDERDGMVGEDVDPAEGMLDVSAFTFFDGNARNMHRWGGVSVAILSLVVTMLAFYVRADPDRSQFVWKLSSVVLAGLVGWVGHQGGEIHYGEDLYDAPIERIKQLMSEPAVAENNEAPAPQLKVEADESTDEAAEETTDEAAGEEATTDVPADAETATQTLETESDDDGEEDGAESDDGAEGDGDDGDGDDGDGDDGDGTAENA